MTNQDKARECAEELTGYLVICGIIEEDDAATLSDTTYDFAHKIAKHFPPAQESETRSGCVPVEKLEEAMKELNETGKHLFSTELAKLLGKTIDKVQALIAEAEQESHCERISDMDLP